MSSCKEYLAFILEQISFSDDISYRMMMGEYILYYRGKIFGGIYDNRFLVKITKSSSEMLPFAAKERPYCGAKEMLLVDDLENKDFLCKLIKAIYAELPTPNRNKNKCMTTKKP